MLADCVILVILTSNLFWDEFLRFIVLLVVVTQRDFEREGRSTLISTLGLLVTEK